jgi:hypothetical protein
MSQNQGDQRHDDPIQDARPEFIVTEHSGGTMPGGRATGAVEARPEPPLDRKSGGTVSVMTLIIASALALIFGLVGAWAYDAFFAGPPGAEQAQASQGGAEQGKRADTQEVPPVSGPQVGPGPDAAIRAEAARIDRLAEQVDQLRAAAEREETGPNSESDALGDRVAEIEGQVAALGPIPRAFEGLARQFREQSGRMDSMADTIDRLESELTTLKDRVGASGGIGGDLLGSGLDAMGQPLDADSDAERNGEAPPDPGRSEGLVRRLVTPDPDDADGTADTALERGIDRFKADEFVQARQAFFELLEQQPSDARIWYYAALANGKATGEWKGETERLVLQGVERERAGTPPKTAIDAAIADLVERQGRAWLDYYRRRADE